MNEMTKKFIVKRWLKGTYMEKATVLNAKISKIYTYKGVKHIHTGKIMFLLKGHKIKCEIFSDKDGKGFRGETKMIEDNNWEEISGLTIRRIVEGW